jgi:small GTP-binding protein
MQSVKVVVTGPFNAGKTTFIKAVSEITVLSTERKVSEVSSEADAGDTTVAMDFGRITISDEVVLYLFGTPGQERFSFMWETLSEGMLGFVVLVDVTSGESISDAVSMISFFRDMADVPFIVAANRIEEGDATALDSVRESLQLDSDIPLFPVDARDKESVKTVLIGLMKRILESMS